MKFKVLLFALFQILRVSALTRKEFKKRIANIYVGILFRTEDKEIGRLIILDRGKVRSRPGADHPCDVALVFKNADVGFAVLTNKKKDAMFNAAAAGDMHLEGMSAWAVWLEEVMALIM